MIYNGIYMVSVTGCDDCPVYDEENKICKLIKNDTCDGETEERQKGRIKKKCPFNVANFIAINLNEESLMPSFRFN